MPEESAPDQDLRRVWTEVDSQLRVALEASAFRLPERADVEHFLDVNELGLAWDALVGVLEERTQSVSDGAINALRRAATLMDLPSDDLHRLEPLSGPVRS